MSICYQENQPEGWPYTTPTTTKTEGLEAKMIEKFDPKKNLEENAQRDYMLGNYCIGQTI